MTVETVIANNLRVINLVDLVGNLTLHSLMQSIINYIVIHSIWNTYRNHQNTILYFLFNVSGTYIAPTPQEIIPQDGQATEQESSPSMSTVLSILLPAIFLILAVAVLMAGLHYRQKHTGFFLSFFLFMSLYLLWKEFEVEKKSK